MKKHDDVSNPAHYDLFPGVQAIDVIEAALTKEQFAGYLMGNAIKYRLRAGRKGDAEQDLAKSEWYRARAETVMAAPEAPVECGEIRIDTAIGEWPESSAVQPEAPAERTILRSQLPDWVPADAEYADSFLAWKMREGVLLVTGRSDGGEWMQSDYASLDSMMHNEERAMRIIEDQPSQYGISDADGFYPWSGGECPVRCVSVELKFRDGTRTKHSNPTILYWQHAGTNSDIIGWKLA